MAGNATTRIGLRAVSLTCAYIRLIPSVLTTEAVPCTTCDDSMIFSHYFSVFVFVNL